MSGQLKSPRAGWGGLRGLYYNPPPPLGRCQGHFGADPL